VFATLLSAHGYSSDPLPSCSALSPQLTLRLLDYVRLVQAPHLHAQCDDLHVANRRCSNTLWQWQRRAAAEAEAEAQAAGTQTATPSMLHSYDAALDADEADPLSVLRPRWLMVSCGADGCGGLSDRLKGIVSLLLYALLTRRAFALDFPFPVPLAEALLPSVLPWMDGEYMRSLREHQGVGVAAGASIEWSIQAGTSWPEDLRRDDVEVLTVRSNSNFVWALFDRYPAEARHLGFDPTADMDRYFGCLFDFLFRPSRQLHDLLAHTAGDQLAAATMQRTFPWPTLQRARSEEQAQLADPGAAAAHAAAAPSPLFCGQLRFGSSVPASSTFVDTESFLTLEDVQRLLKVLRQQADQWLNRSGLPVPPAAAAPATSTARLLVTSDSSPATLDLLLARVFPSPQFDLLSFDPQQYPILHIDKVSPTVWSARLRRAGLLRAVAEYVLLGMCTSAVISPSAFAATAVWRTAWREGHQQAADERYQRVRRFSGGGTVRAFEHTRGGSGRDVLPAEEVGVDSALSVRDLSLLLVLLAVILMFAFAACGGVRTLHAYVRSITHQVGPRRQTMDLSLTD